MRELRQTAPMIVTLFAISQIASACDSRPPDASDTTRTEGKAGQPDTAFAALQERGRIAMGVDQYTSAHVFEPLPTGGRIVLRRNGPDSASEEAMRAQIAGEATIRAHMAEIAAAFGKGDFAIPGAVHAMNAVPGTAEMRRLRGEISYVARDLPGGGEVRITARSAAAVKAVHEFLAFQRADHRAGMH